MTEKEKAIADIYNAARNSYPQNLLYVMPDELSKKLKSFMLIKEDLVFVSQVAEQLIVSRESQNSNVIMESALWQSIVITYGKCFMENKAGMSKLERSMLEKHDMKYQDIHDRLIEVRHKYIAHRDDSINEQTMVFIKVSKTGHMLDGDTEDIIISRKLSSWRISDIKLVLELLDLLIKEASEKIQKHSDKAHNAFLQKYTPQQARHLLVNHMKFD